jgi:hypothetical protein
MIHSKPIASLSSGLLARKGQARPAMRPQGFLQLGPAAQEDLGWNDMGEEAIVAPAPKPMVLREREALDAEFAPEPLPTLSKGALARVAREAAAKHGKSAFTLRLDNDRHLRLRLASAVTNRSAQQLVTQALDAFLGSLAEVEALARQITPAADRG